ncbi:hypothetical protein BH10ACI1_BH10ACI1_16090 [soil metagenome]
MPETNENEVPTPQPKKKRNELTEAKFFEDVEKIIAEAEREGVAYNPPNPFANLSALQTQRNSSAAQRTVNQASDAIEETKRNNRENLYKILNSDVTSLVDYVKSAGMPENDVNALKSIARTIKGGRAEAIDKNDGAIHISVAHLSYASRADNYARFIEQYESLGIVATEDMYKAATHRAKLAALQQANTEVITAEANTNTSGELLDKLAYLDDNSLMNGCISAKAYIKSKYKTTGQPYKNIAKTRFVLPSRLRKKK